MALTRTAAQLLADARNRADQKVGAFRDTATGYRYLTESCRSLVERLVTDFGETYWCCTASVFAAPNQIKTSMPDGAWKLLFMRVTINGKRDKIGRAQLDAIDSEATSVGGWAARWPKHLVMGGAIHWTPIPRASHQVTVYYVPTSIFRNAGGNAVDNLTADTDKFDGVDGWERWVVLDTAIKLLSDEKKDTAALELEAQKRYDEISAAAADRVASEPAQVQDTWRSQEGCDW